MSHDHEHTAGAGHTHGRGADRRALALTLALISSYMLAEVVGGLLIGSLALLADAAHMLSDALSLSVALFASRLAERPATGRRTFGYKRAEILAALFNGVTLVAISIWIFIEAAQRLSDPPEIVGGWLLVIAVLGLLVNVAGFLILHRSGGESLNVSAATRHVLADLLGSVGVIVAGLVIILTGWALIDPLISILIGVLVLASSWSVLRDSVQILLEGAPRGLDVEQLGQAMASQPGVAEVHDLHVWTITSGFPALSAHVLVGPQDDCHSRRRELEELLERDYAITHTTLQVDHARPPITLDKLKSRPPSDGPG